MKKFAALIIFLLVFGTVVTATPLPTIGQWLITKDLQPGNWLDQKYRGKEMREPLNVVIIDRLSKNAAEAKTRVAIACEQAGYKSRWGHSSGYKGEIAGVLYEQISPKDFHAFSDRIFLFSNNHGRIFGPAKIDNKFYFVAAFSREVVDYLKISEIHQFGSFDQARDNFSWSLDNKSEFKVIGFEGLGNTIINDPKLTTGDHDGLAVVLGN